MFSNGFSTRHPKKSSKPRETGELVTRSDLEEVYNSDFAVILEAFQVSCNLLFMTLARSFAIWILQMQAKTSNQ